MITCDNGSEFSNISDLIIDALIEQEGHHKQWYLEQIAKLFGIDYEEEKKEYGIEDGIIP